MKRSIRMVLLRVRNVALLAVLLWGAASAVQADARTDFLIRMLDKSEQFRVRAQAALALGSQKSQKAIVDALEQGLRDRHPAVRAASAAALERLEARSALAALRAAQNDRDGSVRTAVRNAIAALEPVTPPDTGPVVPRGRAVYYLGVGRPGGNVTFSTRALTDLRAHLTRTVEQLEGVKIAPEGEQRGAAERVLRKEKLVGFYIDSSVTSLEERPDGSVRAQVSVVLNTYPGRDIRAMLSGAATVSGGGAGEAAKLQAVQAAFTGALRSLPQALEAGLARAQQ